MVNKHPVLFFGGTFNPPHIGHVKIVSYLISKMDVSMVYVVPSYSPPHKQDPDLADYIERYEMTEKIFSDLIHGGKVVVSDMEKSLPAPSYTYQSLESLRKTHPESAILPVVGMDMYLNLDQWMNYPELRASYNFIVLQRQDLGRQMTSEGDKILDNPYWNISSRDIRDLIREYYQNQAESLKLQVEELITPEVFEYILQRKLYNKI